MNIELAKYRYDVKGFAKDVLGIELHPGQVRFANNVLKRNKNRPWRAAYLTIALSAGNRAGKTLGLAVVILHSVIFKLGVEMPDIPDMTDAAAVKLFENEMLRYVQHPYMWFHFAIQQEIAELVYTDIILLLQGNHVGQKNGCPLGDQFEAEGHKLAEWEKKYNGDYRWIVMSRNLGGGEIHFRTTAEKALGSLGRDMHGISFDECGFEPKLLYIFNNVLHLRRLGTGGQVLLVSTPEEGLTEFADLWFMGDPEQPDRRPGRMSMRMSTRDNIGYGLNQEDFDVLTADMGEDHIKQNIDGFFIQGRTNYFNFHSIDRAFVDELPEMQAAKHNHVYIQGVDPALTYDSLWSIVLDVTGPIAFGVSAQRMRGKKTTDGIVNLAESQHFAYNVDQNGRKSTCATAIDATGFGGKMFKEQLETALAGVVRSVEFGGVSQKKRRLLGDLRTKLDTGKLQFPRTGIWLVVRRQLLGYKLDDRHIEQDAVMTLAVAVSEMRRVPVGGQEAVPFDAFATQEVPVQVGAFTSWRRPRGQ